jgi:hypothetical protein
MKKEMLWCAMVCLSVAAVKANAGAKNDASGESSTCQNGTSGFYDPSAGELRAAMTGFVPSDSLGGGAAGLSIKPASRKKPVIGVLLSSAVPGAGQMYAGSWIKGTVFLAAEVALWVGYRQYTDKGNRLRTEFRAYADTHWSKDKWEGLKDPTDPSTHNLPDTKTQQYYEMIGKYNQFMKGWDDWVSGGPNLTPRRDYYETMRNNHNHQLINASRCAMVSLCNHLLSSLDAAWTIHRHNMKLQARAGMGVSMARNTALPTVSLSMAWQK